MKRNFLSYFIDIEVVNVKKSEKNIRLFTTTIETELVSVLTFFLHICATLIDVVSLPFRDLNMNGVANFSNGAQL
jgi:hypothetical protein